MNLGKTIGIGLIGTGFMGKCHALAWNSVKAVFSDCPQPKLRYLADTNVDRGIQKADAFGFEKSTENWREVIDDPQVDIVSITTPNQFHAEMAIAALEAGKHVWCEKPMATAFDDAQRMLKASQSTDRIAILGYNYIQSPLIRHLSGLLQAEAIGQIHHIRIEMDEDFMADSSTLFSWKSAKTSGYGALDDFAVHPLSLLSVLMAPISEVMTDMSKPYAYRDTAEGIRQEVETYDVANVMLRFKDGATGALMVNRTAWGRKGRIALQLYGSKGSILFDQERMNELQIYQMTDDIGMQGYKTILAAPEHSPYGEFVPAPGHGLGFNDLKVIECKELLAAIAGRSARVISFEEGIEIERIVHAMAESFHNATWVKM